MTVPQGGGTTGRHCGLEDISLLGTKGQMLLVCCWGKMLEDGVLRPGVLQTEWKPEKELQHNRKKTSKTSLQQQEGDCCSDSGLLLGDGA